MFNGDIVCRSALFPRFLANGVFDENLLLDVTSNTDKSVYSISVGSRFILRDDNGAHRYGIRAAKLGNERFLRQKGRHPEPLVEKVHYVGFYDLICGDVRSVQMRFYRLGIVWKPEHGNDAHFQVDFTRNNVNATKKELRDERLFAISIIATFLKGPFRAIDPEEVDLIDELMKIELPELAPIQA
ncbi:hypothetical protein CQ052_05100 [Ochrobactrum sp. MYb15]|nr:hypothetical protein CQZ90_03790 [Ochrobactrum sp. MYb19]PRA62604.1 hypothetical protein CQ053_17175 [Ochrobactrum sp. MYb18]PRA76742.1 hypothetical protein CQ049_05100 [Brucella thiophenivorans]PRA93624.1 hypothetical protein CQ051_03790 [Ochrobactrum sp. MYb14]PRA98749.1 hypothetical protein CQ052_05100 [Ochrobactrum sp. MYb15]